MKRGLKSWLVSYCQKLSSLKGWGGLISASGRPWLLLSGRQRITSPVNAIFHFTRAEHHLLHLVGSSSWQVTVAWCSWGSARAPGARRKEPLPPYVPPWSASAKHIWDPEVRTPCHVLWIHVALPRGSLLYPDQPPLCLVCNQPISQQDRSVAPSYLRGWVI